MARTGQNQIIRHLHIRHNTPCLPPKILLKHCAKFLLTRDEWSGEIKNKVYAKCLEGNRGVLCAMYKWRISFKKLLICNFLRKLFKPVSVMLKYASFIICYNRVNCQFLTWDIFNFEKEYKCSILDIGELRQPRKQWQREREKTNGYKSQNNSCRSMPFCLIHFVLTTTARLRRKTSFCDVFMENVNTQRRQFGTGRQSWELWTR